MRWRRRGRGHCAHIHTSDRRELRARWRERSATRTTIKAKMPSACLPLTPKFGYLPQVVPRDQRVARGHGGRSPSYQTDSFHRSFLEPSCREVAALARRSVREAKRAQDHSFASALVVPCQTVPHNRVEQFTKMRENRVTGLVGDWQAVKVVVLSLSFGPLCSSCLVGALATFVSVG